MTKCDEDGNPSLVNNLEFNQVDSGAPEIVVFAACISIERLGRTSEA
jgi:hypothetical protein